MHLAALKRWHWIVIGLVLGFVIGKAQQGFQGELYGDLVEGFGYQLTDQGRFENALTQEYQGYRLFKDITVYPRWVSDNHGGRKLVHVVVGRYWSGHEEIIEGKAQAVWRPTCFIAAVPYKPQMDFLAFRKANSPDYAGQFRAAGPNPTVLDYLNVMQSAAGVSYSYAWWDAHPLLTWTLAGLVIIGLIWPTLINLMTFGTWRRPPEARALSLWGVRGTSERAKPASMVNTAPTDDPDQELEAALQGAAPSDAESGVAPAVKTLSSAPLEPAATVPTGPSKEFGAEKEDFYPTERHAPRKN